MSQWLLQDGLVYDGTGADPYPADIRLTGNRIAEIAPHLSKEAGETCISLHGKVVTPGFIDIHRHCDKNPFEPCSGVHPYGEVLLRQGITSVLTGNCGISMYPQNPASSVRQQMADYYAPVLGDISRYFDLTSYPDYLARLSKTRLPVNTGAMIGMGAVRIAVKGFSDASFTSSEICRCQEIIQEALSLGAPGVSIGLMYLPECYETINELGEILKPVGDYGRIVTAHIRGEGDSLVKSVEEVLQIGKLAGCKVEISHFKSCGVSNWNKEIHRAIRLIEDARSSGQEAACDFYPYDCGSTTLMSMIPPAFVGSSVSDTLARLKTEAGQNQLHEMLKKTYDDWDNYVISLGWDKVILSAASRPKNQSMIGKSISEIAKEYGYPDETAAASHLLTSENGTAAIIIRSMDQADVDAVAALPYSCLISDAIYAETDRPHPRMYGAFPHFIEDYVCRRHVLSLPAAIHKMTGLPAARMNLRARGLIKEGYFADVNVFDPSSLKAPSDYTHPAILAEGLSWCFLNGTPVVKNDEVLSLSEGSFLSVHE